MKLNLRIRQAAQQLKECEKERIYVIFESIKGIDQKCKYKDVNNIKDCKHFKKWLATRGNENIWHSGCYTHCKERGRK